VNAGQNQGALPVLVVQTASQASLAAGAELFINLSLPLNYTLPPPSAGAPALAALCTVNAVDTVNAALVATANLNNGGGSVFQVRVRNVGSAASGTWSVTIMILGPGQAVGL
jgi:hypothetical protein